MVVFFQTGGIGDTILGTAVIKCLNRYYGEKIGVLCLNPLVAQALIGVNYISFVKQVRPDQCRTMEDLERVCPEAELIIFNKFRRDMDGQLNFFCPIGDKYIENSRSFRQKFIKSVNDDLHTKATRLEDIAPLKLIRHFNNEEDYFSDWRRYGLDVSYDEVGLDIYDYTIERNAENLPSDYFIVHDTKLPTMSGRSVYPIKAWYANEWSKLCNMLHQDGRKIVQIVGADQPLFNHAIPHYDIIGHDAMFQDYLHLLSESKMYIGTDSWPAHAAIFIQKPEYLLLKGAVSRRWDHGGSYSNIIRVGKCQACEGPPTSAHKCIWEAGNHSCMTKITAEMVMSKIKEIVDENEND